MGLSETIIKERVLTAVCKPSHFLGVLMPQTFVQILYSRVKKIVTLVHGLAHMKGDITSDLDCTMEIKRLATLKNGPRGKSGMALTLIRHKKKLKK